MTVLDRSSEYSDALVLGVLARMEEVEKCKKYMGVPPGLPKTKNV